MNRALVEQELAGLLMGIGIRAECLRPDIRLLQDLRIDGDDAADFFDAVAARFGTDLSALHSEWNTHFGTEGLSMAAVVPIVLGCVVAGVAAALADFSVVLCAASAITAALLVWLVSCLTSARRLRPIRLSDVADAVERGSWNGSAH